MMENFKDLLGKRVMVRAQGGDVTGTLTEVTEFILTVENRGIPVRIFVDKITSIGEFRSSRTLLNE
jgi:hypothetical protein